MVVTFLPATLEIAVIQVRVASPLICTVQAPQSAMPHPNFVPVMFSVSRKTQSSGMSGLTSTDCALPFKVKLMAMGTSLSQTDILQQLPVKMKIRRNSLKPSAGRLHGSAGAGCVFHSPQKWHCQERGQPREHPARR